MVREPGYLALELVAAQQQLGKIDHTAPPAGFLVALVEPDHLAPRRIATVAELLRPESFVLLRIDEPRDLAWDPARLVELERADELAHHPLLILGIQDLEALRQSRVAPVQSQQPIGDAVERADPERRGRSAELGFDTSAHLASGLVR